MYYRFGMVNWLLIYTQFIDLCYKVGLFHFVCKVRVTMSFSN